MPSISLSPFTSLDEEVHARREALQQRMRIIAAGSVLLFTGLGALSFQAYVEHGALTAAGIFLMGFIFLFESVRQADRRFVAPLQAVCQDEYAREIERALGPLMQLPSPAAPRGAAIAQRIGARRA